MFIESGKVVTLLLLLGELGLILYYYMIVKKGGQIHLRKIPAIDGIVEAVGRAAELGKPIHLATGEYTYLTRDNAPETMGAVTIMSFIAEHCIEKGAELIVSVSKSESLRLHEETLQQLYTKAGLVYDPSMIHYYSDYYVTYYAGIMHTILQTKAAVSMLIGPGGSDMLWAGEAGKMVGAVVISGAGSKGSPSFMVAFSDHFFISEEFYAVVAWIGRELLQLATIRGQDIMKILVCSLIFISNILLYLDFPIKTFLGL